MSKKLGNRVRVLNIQLVTNTNRKDFELLEEIAKALNLTIEATEPVESIRAISGWRGSLSRIGEFI